MVVKITAANEDSIEKETMQIAIIVAICASELPDILAPNSVLVRISYKEEQRRHD